MKYDMKKLDELCLIQRGGSPRPIEQYLTKTTNGINWIKIGDAKVNLKYINETAEKITKEGVAHSRKVKAGDLILSNSMSFGRPYILNIDGCIHDGWLVLSDYSQNLDKDFLYYVLSSEIVKKQFGNGARGAIVKNLNIDIVRNLILPVPQIKEQKRIVKVIEEKMNIVEKAKQASDEQIENYTVLKEKLYDKVFEDYAKFQTTVESICNDVSDGTHFTPTYVNQGIPFLSVKDLTKGYISFDNCRYITKEEHRKLIERCNPQLGDVLYTKVGTTGIAKAIDVKKIFSIFVSVALLKLKDNISPQFIEKVLNLPYCKKQAEVLTQGATNKNLVLQDLKTIKLYCPDFSEQIKIVNKLEKIDRQLNTLFSLMKEQSSYINALPSAILRQAFEGKL